jgi:hypothetical protein
MESSTNARAKRIRILAVLLSICAFSLLFSPVCLGAQTVHDLGQGLLYLRVHDLPTDIPGKGSDARLNKAMIIIDLRDAKAGRTEAVIFSAWLGFRCTPDAPTLVLLNQDSASSLVDVVLGSRWPGLLSLAPNDVAFTPDLQVDTSLEQDKHACAAIAQGQELLGLASMTISKERYDESALSRDYQDGIHPTRERNDSSSAPAPSSEENLTAKDLVLATAIHLHRALVALRLK